jgi:hypothetical protein
VLFSVGRTVVQPRGLKRIERGAAQPLAIVAAVVPRVWLAVAFDKAVVDTLPVVATGFNLPAIRLGLPSIAGGLGPNCPVAVAASPARNHASLLSDRLARQRLRPL